MMLIIFQVLVLAVGILFLLSGSQEKVRFNRVADYVVGYLLLVLMMVTMYIWR